ncbi:hypothetical protein HDU91_003982 [Kappamyces sp. JEL0680]|nr:hypothetical protein HDU91_003982 [Kappamyces sp. JEL0680]
MEDLQRAIGLLSSSAAGQSNADPVLKEQAISYCNQVKQSPNGWELCIGLADSTGNADIRFFCFQVLEERLKAGFLQLSAPQQLQIRKSIWGWLLEHLTKDRFPFYLKNKLFLLVVLLFKVEYPLRWPTFFDDLFQLMGSADSSVALDTFLNICVIIDDEVIGHYIQKTPGQQAHNNVIKDAMREGPIAQILATWHSVFATCRTSNVPLASLCLKLFGLYVTWIDINLIAKPDFVALLYDTFTLPSLRIQACECLGYIIAKGMKPFDKINFIESLNVLQFLRTIPAATDDVEFDESVAKLVNGLGEEVCACYEDEQSTENEKLKALQFLEILYPLMLQYLGNEYDDTAAMLLPFVSSYLSVLKKVKKTVGSISKDSVASLLEVLALKMKYDSDEEYRLEDAGEEEALFLEMRKSLKIPFDSIASLNYELFSASISQLVCRVFQSARPDSQSAELSVKWVDAELALYLLYIFVESKNTKGPPAFLLPDSITYTPLGLMLTEMMDSSISSYPHPSIPVMYFEIITRYSSFFETRPVYLPQALQSFLDSRGLFHPVKPIRLRVNYLFLRFIKSIKGQLAQYVEGMLAALQELLLVRRRNIQKLEDIAKCGDFDSQLFLFEAAGYLIALDDIPAERKEGLLTIVIVPLLRRVEDIIQQSASGDLDLGTICELGELISALGCIAKGFPDFESTGRSAIRPFWAIPFKTILQGILVVLGKYNMYPSIRNAVSTTPVDM